MFGKFTFFLLLVKYKLNNTVIDYPVNGKKRPGDNIILLDKEDDLTANTSWAKKGYTVEKFLSPKAYQQLKTGIQHIIANKLKISNADFQLEHYHRFVSDRQHFALISQMKYFDSDGLPVSAALVTERISAICKIPLTNTDPFYRLSIFHLRIIRPDSHDNNPLHKDAWLDNLKNAINIYVPLAGSNRLSSLCLVTGSHRWKESETERTANGATVNKLSYKVPAVTAIRRKFKLIRPNPAENEVLVFSPYLLHGGAVNLNKDLTRVSLEMRFWRKN